MDDDKISETVVSQTISVLSFKDLRSLIPLLWVVNAYAICAISNKVICRKDKGPWG